MITQLLYLNDVTTLVFKAEIRQKKLMSDGRLGVILDQTYFYPTGGGQEHDTGTLGEACVIDVIKDETSPETEVIHVIEGDVPLGPVTGKIDAERRLRNMQHHTAQHLLSQCFMNVFGIESISTNINGYTPSTIDLSVEIVTREQLDKIEDTANYVIYETRPVRTYFVTPDQLLRLPLRKPPKVSENIRIVEIDGYDFSPCGGTHCISTGQIGVIKILKSERQGEQTRIHFIAGLQALQYFREYQNTVLNIAGQMSIHPQDVYPNILRLMEQLKTSQREAQMLLQEHLAFEARELTDKSEAYGSLRFVIATFENRPVPELRTLAENLKIMPGFVAILASYDGQKISLVVTSSVDTGLAARDILAKILRPFSGHGGGDRQIAQGGGTVTRDQYRQFSKNTRDIILKI